MFLWCSRGRFWIVLWLCLMILVMELFLLVWFLVVRLSRCRVVLLKFIMLLLNRWFICFSERW